MDSQYIPTSFEEFIFFIREWLRSCSGFVQLLDYILVTRSRIPPISQSKHEAAEAIRICVENYPQNTEIYPPEQLKLSSDSKTKTKQLQSRSMNKL